MQDKVRAFLKTYRASMEAPVRYIDVVSEVGELGKELLKTSQYGAMPVTQTPDMQMEAGDCLFSLLALLESIGIDAEAALDTAIAKYERRAAQTGSIGSAPQ